MYRLNQRLGFVPMPANTHWETRLPDRTVSRGGHRPKADSTHEPAAIVEHALHQYRRRLGEISGGALNDGTDLKWTWTGQSHLNMVFGARMAAHEFSFAEHAPAPGRV